MGQESVLSEGERGLAELKPRLDALGDQALLRPGTDPHAAAVTALLVSDYLAQPVMRSKLAGVGLSAEAPRDLGHLARAILATVARLDGDYLPDGKSVPGDLVQRGYALRTAMLEALQRAMPDDRDIALWVEAIQLGQGVVDLVYDLRTVSELHWAHAARLEEVGAANGARAAQSAADGLEHALRAGESSEQGRQRDTLVRLWTLFLPAYEAAAVAGRALTRGEGKERDFPSLARVASHRRARRRPLSLVPVRRSVPAGSGAPPASGALSSVPPLADLPEDLLEIETVTIVRSEPPPVASGDRESRPSSPGDRESRPSSPGDRESRPSSPGDRESRPSSRRTPRQVVELEVGISSESNFYVGFTENLSSSGIFVATYAAKPIGSKIEIALAFPNGDELHVPGVVKWLREASHDGWPGMGVQFEALSASDEAKVRKFLSLREPMFYDD